MWGIETQSSRGWRGFVRTRLMSLGVILVLGFLLLVSLSVTTAVSAMQSFVARYTGFLLLTEALNLLLSLGISTLVVALIYQYMAARRLAWKLVFYGGARGRKRRPRCSDRPSLRYPSQ